MNSFKCINRCLLFLLILWFGKLFAQSVTVLPEESRDITYLMQDFQVNDNTSGRCQHRQPAVAMKGDGRYVVAWTDYRDVHRDVYFQIFDANGNRVGSNIRVNDDTGKSDQYYPEIAMDGNGNFVIIWEDQRNTSATNGQIYGQRYTSDGTSVGSNFMIRDSADDLSGYDIAMTHNGRFIAVWDHGPVSGYKIEGQRYHANGAVNGETLTVIESLNSVTHPTVEIAESGRFVVAYDEFGLNYGIQVQRFDSDGSKIGNPVKANDTEKHVHFPHIGMDDAGNYVIVWEAKIRNNWDGDIRGQRFDLNGNKLGSNFVAADNTYGYFYPDVAMNNQGAFTVLWLNYREIQMQRYSNGVAQGGRIIVANWSSNVYKTHWDTKVAVGIDDDGNSIALWDGGIDGYEEIIAQRFTSAGVVNGDPFRVNDDVGSESQINPTLAINSSGEFVIAWDDKRNGDSDIYSQQFQANFSRSGFNTLISNDGSTANGFERQEAPATGIDANGNFVVSYYWQFEGDERVRFQRVSNAGVLQGGKVDVFTDADLDQSAPSAHMLSNGRFYLTWTERQSDYTDDIFYQRYLAGGTAEGTVFRVHDVTTSHQRSSAVTVDNAGNTIVAWQDRRDGSTHIYARRFDSTGTPKENEFKVSEQSASIAFPLNYSTPCIGVDDNDRFIICWMNYSNNNDIYGQIYDASGTALGGNLVINDGPGIGAQLHPCAAAFHNDHFIVVWQDSRNGNWDIYGQQIDENGDFIAGNFRIDNDQTGNDQKFPVVAVHNNTLVTAWEDDRVSGQNWDIYANAIDVTTLPLGNTVATPVFSPPAGTYPTPPTVSATCETPGAEIRMTSDGSEPNENSPLFVNPITIYNSTTLKIKAYKTGWLPSETVTAEYIITDTVATPIFYPTPGTYASTVTVTLSSSTLGATIYYTTDGSEPTSDSALYTSGIAVFSTTTLKAKAYKDGWTPSNVATGTYTINGPVATPTFIPPGGHYTTPQTVSISTATAGATIRYTMDGSDPSENSSVYSNPIQISSTTTIKARGYKTNFSQSAIASATYTISAYPIIFPSAPSTLAPGSEFWMDIQVGSANSPVNNLFGISFNLKYPTNDIDVVTPYTSAVLPGDFFGADHVFFQNVDENTGTVSVGISKKDGQGGASGNGSVARVRFMLKSGLPEGTEFIFSLSDIEAIDVDGNTMSFQPGTHTLTVSGGFDVWPGDTDNDGVVDQADVLPVGQYWNQTGPARDNATIQWQGQAASAWNVELATYADGNGDGIVNEADVLPIGLNWGKVHSGASLLAYGTDEGQSKSSIQTGYLELRTDDDIRPGSDFWVDVHAVGVKNLFGIAFCVVSPNGNPVEFMEIEIGNALGEEGIFISRIRNTAKEASIGVSRKAGHGGVDGPVLISRLRARLTKEAVGAKWVILSLKDVAGVDFEGNPIKFNVSDFNLSSFIKDLHSSEIPNSFVLYQNVPNPFNPETRIKYTVPSDADIEIVRISIFNMRGEKIRTLVNGPQQPGVHEIVWDTRDDHRNEVSGGMYLCRLEAGSFVSVKKMLLIR